MAKRPTDPPERAEPDPISPERLLFVEILKRLRLARGLKQAELAMRAGIRQAHYSQLETGNWEPRFQTIINLAKALRVQPSRLMPKVTFSDPEQ